MLTRLGLEKGPTEQQVLQAAGEKVAARRRDGVG